jgi:hypothetical protein
VHDETFRRLLPGYVRRFIEHAAPRLQIGIEGSLDSCFSLTPLEPGALDTLWSSIERYSEAQRRCLTVYRPKDDDEALFVHPGEPLFDQLKAWVSSRFGGEALRGAVFVDPSADEPYLFHVGLVAVERKSDPTQPEFSRTEPLEYRLVALRQPAEGPLEECPVEHLLVLAAGSPHQVSRGAMLGANAVDSVDLARTYLLERVARRTSEERREALMKSLQERIAFVRRGYDFLDAELAARRSRLRDRSSSGNSHAKRELALVREEQRRLEQRREGAIARLELEPDLIAVGDVTFFAHALVVPSSDTADERRQTQHIEEIAIEVARAYERAADATVIDVSSPQAAAAAGLPERPGFDLLSTRPDGSERAIEVKGRARVGDVELTENEWIRACNLRDKYWLYVIFNCGTPNPLPVRIRDPFQKLLGTAKGGIIFDERAIFLAGELG